MKRTSPRDPNYAFGQAMLTLRSRMGLTQAGLAKLLGVSRYALGDWEAGENYPKVEHMKHFIALALQHRAFPPGHEAEEIRALWKLARQRVLLDERWLTSLFTSVPTQETTGAASPSPQQPDETQPASGERGNVAGIPAQPTPFVGRASEQTEIARILADPACRLLTLLGPGGIGKTRLALEIAAGQTDAFADGVVVVLLASINTTNQLVSAIADALPASFTGQADSVDQVFGYLRGRQMLLVLDNFEHLLEGVDLIFDLLENAPQIKLLVTSRERLNLRTEWLFDIGGLAFPSVDPRDLNARQRAETFTKYSAVQLFVQRIAQIQPQFPLTEANLTTIARICHAVAGMPLAIELAAANLRLLPIEEIEGQLRANLDALAATLHDVPARHQSLRVVFDQSWNLLDEPERALFSHLAVFRGGCTLEAAMQIAGATFPLIMALIDKSLVHQINVETETQTARARANVVQEKRFFMLEPIREYAREKLAARGELDAIHHAHAQYYLALADAAAAQWDTPAADEAIAQLDLEHDNMRVVLQWACDGGDSSAGLRLGGSLRKFWQRRGYFTEGRAWLETLLSLEQETSDPAAAAARADGMNTAAWLASDQNDYVQATQLFKQSMELRHSLGEVADDRRLLSTAARQARADGHFQRATALLEDALARDRALGDRGSLTSGGLGLSLYDLGLTLREQGEFERATALFEECVQLHQTLGDREGMSIGLLGLSDVARDLGDSDGVREYGEQCLAFFRELNVQWAIGFALNNLALAAHRDGDLTRALALSTESVTLFRGMQAEGSLAEVLITYGAVLLALGDVSGAYQALNQSLQIARAIGPRLLVAAALEGQASVVVQMGDVALAAQMLAEASGRRVLMGTPVRPVDQPVLKRTLAAARALVGEEAFTALWMKALPLDQNQPPVSAENESPASAPAAAQPAPTSDHAASAAQKPRVDWSSAVTVPRFYGREQELTLLTDWIVEEHCRIVSIVGMGGIGKSTLAVNQMQGVAAQFDFVIWRSLRDAPTCDVLLNDCLQVLTAQTLPQTPANLEALTALLLEYLRANRVLLVLDNLETLMDEGTNVGYMRPGYEGYGRLLRQIAETNHRSCLLLTTREKVTDLVSLEGSHAPVRTLRLTQLDGDSCGRLLAEKDITGSSSEKAELIQAYAGNPLALKIVAQTIAELFDGEISPFLEQGEVIFGSVRRLLNEQFSRLSPLEQDVMIWLAILREPSTLADLRTVMVRSTASAALLETLESLHRRSLIERGQARGSFTLQSVVQEYVTARLITDVSGEIEGGQPESLVKYGLELAHTREYVRQIEARLIVTPVLDRLRSIYTSQSRLETHLLALLRGMAAQNEAVQGYGPANLVTLLLSLRGNLRGVDLSQLALRGVDFQGVEMQDASLAASYLRDSLFTSTFNAIMSIAVSPSGTHWAVLGMDGEIRVWEAANWSLYRSWASSESLVGFGLSFSNDGRALLRGNSHGSVELWDIESKTLRWTSWHTGVVYNVAMSPTDDTVASAGNDAAVRLWDARTGEPLETLPHSAIPTIVVWSSDGQLLASGDEQGTIRVWAVSRTAPAVCLETISAHSGAVTLSFSPDNTRLASVSSGDGTLKLWDVSSGRLRRILGQQLHLLSRIVWSPDGRILAVHGRDPVIRLWDAEEARPLDELRGHSAEVPSVAFTPDSRSLLSGSYDGTLRLWDVASRRCVRILQGYAVSLFDVDWSPDGRQVVSGSLDGLVTTHSVGNEVPARSLKGHKGVVFGVRWSPDGRWLAGSGWENSISLWDAKSGVLAQSIYEAETIFNGLDWSPDGQYLAIGTYRAGVLIWDMAARSRNWIGRDFPLRFIRVAWSPDGRYFASAGEAGSIFVWKTDTWELLLRVEGNQGTIKGIDWSPDGTQLASAGGSQSGELFVWDIQSGECLYTFQSPELLSSVVWGALGKTLISGGEQGILHWWDVKTGKLLWVRNAHNGAIQALRRSPDGTTLASCGDDGAIMLWDITSGEPLQTLRRDRPYERLDITGIKGLTEAQKEMLHALGAISEA